MQPAGSTVPPTLPATFGEMLKYVRRRARLTQRELAIAVGYSEAHLCRLEQNQRLPDLTTLLALFVPTLDLDDAPELTARLLDLAAAARDARSAERDDVTQSSLSAAETSGLEQIPAAPTYAVARPQLLAQLSERLRAERIVGLCALGGMGKTTLAAALARQEQQTRPVFWLTLTTGVTTSVEALLRQLALFLLAQGHVQVRPLLQSRAAPTLALDQQLALLGAALARQPVLLCFDNVHLVQHDPAVVQVLQHLAAATPAALLLTSREAVPLPGVAQMRLRGLEQSEGHQLIERLWPAGRTPLPPTLIERLLCKTDGSPMLLRLALGHLRDQPGDPASFVERLAMEPQVASYLLESVVGQLGRPALRLAQLIAVFRQPLDLYDATLIALAADSPADLAAALAELQRRQLIDHPARATLHALVRDQLYTGLTLDAMRRQRLHQIAAEWSEQVAGDLVEAAYHACQAGEIQQAVDVLSDQGEVLLNRGQAQAAAEVVDLLLTRLRRESQSDELVRQLLTVRGDVLVHSLRAAEAEADYRRALALATQQPGSARLRAQLAWRLAYGLMQRGEANEAVALCQTAAAAVSASDTLLLAQLAAAECRALLLGARYEQSAQIARRALELADQIAGLMPGIADEVRARAHNALGIILEFWRQFAPAHDHLQHAVVAARRANMRQFEQRCIMNVGGFLLEQGDLPGALERYSTALSGAQALGDSYTAELILHNLAVIHYLRGELDAALARLGEACAIDEQMGNAIGRADNQQQRARVLLAQGRTAEARTTIDGALVALAAATERREYGYALDTLSMVQLVQGDIAGARTTLAAALALPVTAEDGQLGSAVRQRLAVALLADGDLGAAQRTLEAAPPVGSGLEVLFEQQLVQGSCALLAGDCVAAASLARMVAERAVATGYRLYERPAVLLLAAIQSPPAPQLLPRLLWSPEAQASSQPAHLPLSVIQRQRLHNLPTSWSQRLWHVA